MLSERFNQIGQDMVASIGTLCPEMTVTWVAYDYPLPASNFSYLPTDPSFHEIEQERQSDLDLDYDLLKCLEYNPQSRFNTRDIARILAVHEGYNDEEDWRWILELKDKTFVYLRGGCDYTGWDCQSSAVSVITRTAKDAADIEKLIFGGAIDVHKSLIKQLRKGKKETWRDKKDKEFGLKE